MLSLHVVGCGKENMHKFIAFLQNEIKAYIKQNNTCFYNLKTLWKAEITVELLHKKASFILPFDRDTTCEYWGFVNVNDWEALYSKLFSPIKIDEPSYSKHQHYTFSRLKLLLKQFSEPLLESSQYIPPLRF